MHTWKKFKVKVFEQVQKPDGSFEEKVKEKIEVLAENREHAFNLANAKLAEREKLALIAKHVEEV